MARSIVLAVLLFAVAACKPEEPYVDASGGLLFSFRDRVFTGTFLVRRLRELPAGSTIELTLDNPAGGAPLVVASALADQPYLELNTPVLSGVTAEIDYKVVFRLVGADGAELQKIEKKVRSRLTEEHMAPIPVN